MLNPNKHTETRPKRKPISTLRTAHVCTYHSAQLSYTTQHRTVLVILILQTIVIDQTMFTWGVKALKAEHYYGSC